jgi:hypothetical protein
VLFTAHAGAGELHLRPVLNLKTKEGFTNSLLQKLQFGQKKYRGSLSEHGDGIVESEFFAFMIGQKKLRIA